MKAKTKQLTKQEEKQNKLELQLIEELDKLDNPKKKQFVALYNQLLGHISNTCSGVGISRQTYYDWLEDDSDFRDLILNSEMNLNDELRQELINKAATGDTKALIFYLTKRHPDFKEKANGPIIQFNTRVDYGSWGQ